jgi:hypothetical protein
MDKRWYDWFAEPILFSSISEWHIIFTDFAFPAETIKYVDVLSTEGILYRGLLSDSFFNSDGELTGLLLEDPYRFDRDEYVDHKKADLAAHIKAMPDEPLYVVARDREAYWRPISKQDFLEDNLFYIPKDRISNLNVRHRTVEEKIPQAAESRLMQRDIDEFIVSEEPPERNDESPS